MFRIIGLFALSGLVAGTLWVARDTKAQEQSSWDTADPFAAPADPSPSPQASRPVTPADDPFFAPQPVGPDATPATAASPLATDAYRRRVSDYVRQALRALQEGDEAEALRLATTAERMAARAKLTFKPGEKSPRQLIAQIKGEAPASPVLAQGAPTVPADGDVDRTRQYVQLLLQSAQEHLDQGNLEAARQKALQAQQVEVTYGPFDRTPEQLLTEIAQRQPASPAGPSEAFLASWNPSAVEAAGSTPQAPAEMPEQPALPEKLEGLPAKEQATALLKMARTSFDKGHFDEAHSYVLAAEKLPVSYELLEERPETLLAEIERKTNTEIITPTAHPVPTGNPSDDRVAAQQLVKQAREALGRGDLDGARKHAEAAISLNATFALFDDRPELVLQDLDSQLAQSSGPSENSAAPAMPADIAAADSPFATPQVEQASGEQLPARDLFEQGVTLLREGEREAAYQKFLQAYHSGEKLDPHRQQQLQDKLRELAPGREIQQVAGQSLPTLADPGAMQASHLDAAIEHQAIKYDKHRTEVMNAIFRAEKLREDKPEEALELLNQTIADLESSDLAGQHAARLMASLKSTRDSIDSYATQRKPITQLQQQNREIRDQINLEIETKVRIEQELAKIVDDFNRLMDERRYAEAMTLAKRARELDPENPVVVTMDWKSKFAYQNDRNNQLREAKSDSFLKQLDDVEWAAVNPVGDKNPIAYDAERWEQLVKGASP